MRIWFDENEKNEKLESFEVQGKEIYTKYLDGSIGGPAPYTEWNINVFNNTLKEQAIERNESKKAEQLFKDRRIESIINTAYKMLLTAGILTSVCSIIISHEIMGKVLYIILTLLFSSKMLLQIKNHKEYVSEHIETWEELEKYDEFLTLQTEYENYGITINDLDNYSLDQIKDIGAEMNEAAKTKKLV